MNSTLAMEVVKAEEFATYGHDMGFRKHPGLEKVETRTTLKELHDNLQLVVDHERSVVPHHIFQVALSEVGNLLLDFGDIVIGMLKIYNRREVQVRQYRPQRTRMDPWHSSHS